MRCDVDRSSLAMEGLMTRTLVVGFKGKNNASRIMAEQVSSEHMLLTNSFAGLKRDIDSISKEFDQVIMFGVDKTLISSVRIEEAAAVDKRKAVSDLDLEKIASALENAGIQSVISKKPTTYLCNEAYWHILEKYSGRAVLIHIPTIRHVDAGFVEKVKSALGRLRIS